MEKKYKYFIDLFLIDKKIFDSWNPSDVVWLSELPYPLYNDLILSQYEEKKKEKKALDERLKEQEQKQQKIKNRLIRKRQK